MNPDFRYVVPAVGFLLGILTIAAVCIFGASVG